MEDEQNLLEYLMQKNPEIDTSNSIKGGNTQSNGDMWKKPVDIVEWTDFEPQSLLKAFKGRLAEILKTNLTGSAPLPIPAFPFREIHDEDSLETLLILWNQQIVSNALVVAQDQLPAIRSSGRIYMARGGQAQSPKAFPKDRKKQNSYPDWAAVRQLETTGPQDPKAANILPGDTKISSKWKSENMKDGDANIYNVKSKAARPVLQVYNYCLKADVRYGYIITDQELVVLRVRVVDTGDSQTSQEIYASENQKKARSASEVELKSIPWASYDDRPKALRDKLTVNLALWWLHLMAASCCSIESQYPRLCDELMPLDATASSSDSDDELMPLNATASFSVSGEIAGLDLDQSFTSQISEKSQTGKKRKRLELQTDEKHPKRRGAKQALM